MKATSALFGLVGVLLPVVVMSIDRLSPHGWWPRWVFYVWPTSYMLIANEVVAKNSHASTVTVISVILNSFIYALIGFILWSATRTIWRRKVVE